MRVNPPQPMCEVPNSAFGFGVVKNDLPIDDIQKETSNSLIQRAEIRNLPAEITIDASLCAEALQIEKTNRYSLDKKSQLFYNRIMVDCTTPKSAIEMFRNNIIPASARIAVAVSGGEDSMCLMYAMLDCFGADRLVAVHVQHGIRGEESLGDADFVADICKKLGIRLIRVDADIPAMAEKSGASLESEARLFRKKVFDRVLETGEADYVALAHHKQDQIESILMHIFRGSGIGGLRGMSAIGGKILRPFITVEKSEISLYCKENSVPYREDSTNKDDSYSRNFIRNRVVPLLEQRYDLGNIADRLSPLAAADDEFIYSLLREEKFFLSETDKNSCSIDISALSEPYPLLSRYILGCAKRAGLATDIEKKHVDAIKELAFGASGKEICLPGGYVAINEYDRITICKKESPPCDSAEFAIGITAFGDGYINVVQCNKEFYKGCSVFDGDKIPEGAVIRFRRQGDTFIPFAGKRKKLKEYLIDKKIPGRVRDRLPLVCCGEEVLVICGVEISDLVKVTGDTDNCLKIIYTED